MTGAHLIDEQLLDVLHQDDDPWTCQAADHLERCDTCRNRLERMAAEPSWWKKASTHLPLAASGRTDSQVSISAIAAANDQVLSDDCLRVLDPPSHPEMLGRIDQFDVEQLIGRGGMGLVFRGYDHQLNRAVAIKFLAPHLATNGTARKRFEREARAAAAVVHPNVVPIHSIGSAKRAYIVMPLVSGPSLQRYVDEHGPLDEKGVVRIAMQIAAGLSAAHTQGLIHRDIKPGNILIDGDVSRVLITDFGLARAADDAGMTQTGWLAGTPHYMSPEQAAGQDLDARSDLFSLGAVMYFLATGREPFRAAQPLAILKQIGTQSQRPVCHFNPEMSMTLSNIIDRLLEKESVDRFACATETHGVLKRYLAYLQHPQSHRPPRVRLPRRTKRTVRVAVTLGAVVLLMVVAGIGVARLASNHSGKHASEMAAPNSGPVLPGIWSEARYHSELTAIESQISAMENHDRNVMRTRSIFDQSLQEFESAVASAEQRAELFE